jgi:hypothetical protein
MMMRKAIMTSSLCRGLLACCAALLFSCDNMVQYIAIDATEQPVVLAVNATIGTDSVFFLSFSEGRSLSAYRDWKLEQENIIRAGKVTLHDETEDAEIYAKAASFNLSVRSGYTTTVTGLPFKAGNTYRLTLEVAGYPTATATVTMPAAPIVDSVVLPDLQKQPKRYSNAYVIEPFNPNEFVVNPIDCYPVALHLTDNSPERDYYIAYLQTAPSYWSGTPYVAISEYAVIQDNPDVEAAALSTDEVDAFVFRKMLLSDMSFANATGAINLLVDEEVFGVRQGVKPCGGGSSTRVTAYLCVAHITPTAYAYYRSLSLQRAGMGFFSEPVSIPSNIQNGYGCFSAISIVRKPIAAYEVCESGYYEERY